MQLPVPMLNDLRSWCCLGLQDWPSVFTHPFVHHMVRDLSTQREVFDRVTVASVVLDDPLTAAREIDKALCARMRLKRPIYLEIPRDLADSYNNGNFSRFPPPASRNGQFE